jgi:hypothetical protein
MPSSLLAKDVTDSLPVLQRVYHFRERLDASIAGVERNVYMKLRYDIKKRNIGLYLIPTMDLLARSDRKMVMETYNRMKFKSFNKYENQQQLVWGTVPHNRKAMTPILVFLTPNLYAPTIFRNHALSPFHQSNRRFYHYTVTDHENGFAVITFRPKRRRNTQLVSGMAYVKSETGRIIQTVLTGDYDGIFFNTEVIMGNDSVNALLPDLCFTQAQFKFMGNKIYAAFEAAYNCPVTLPDSLHNSHDRALLDSLRPIPLIESEQAVYDTYDSLHPVQRTTIPDSIEKKKSRSKAFLNTIDLIGEKLVGSISARSDKGSLRIYPLLSPQYLSYSKRQGIAYKIRMKADYHFNAHRYFEFKPRLGYNFKFKKFYFTAPLQFYYNPKRDGYVEVVYGNGNRISHASISEKIEQEYGDTIDLTNKNLTSFDDNYLRITNNIMAFDWIDIETGVTFHHRKAYDPAAMRYFNMPTEYRSFAPVLSFKLRPWPKGPLFTIDYERGIKGVYGSSIDYERWEFDGSIKHQFGPSRKLNIRLGGGFYSRRHGNTFVDFTNFRDNNLPEGWDDDWTGNFQLLNNRWYNKSRYYARANLSYESPLLFLTALPVFGHFLERERFYLSGLSIEHTRPYYELGYGFTTRFFTIGLFTNLLSTKFQSFECKFTFELFQRW